MCASHCFLIRVVRSPRRAGDGWGGCTARSLRTAFRLSSSAHIEILIEVGTSRSHEDSIKHACLIRAAIRMWTRCISTYLSCSLWNEDNLVRPQDARETAVATVGELEHNPRRHMRKRPSSATNLKNLGKGGGLCRMSRTSLARPGKRYGGSCNRYSSTFTLGSVQVRPATRRDRQSR